MKDFIEKWNNDKKFKTSMQLLLYTSFVIIVAIFAVSSSGNIPTNEINNQYNDKNEVDNMQQSDNSIEIPTKYSYLIKIKINEEEYYYSGTKNDDRETITKEVDEIITNYIYEDNSYYQEQDDNYLLTTEEEVYDIIDHNYLNLKTINEYLSKSTKEENQYLVYLKDIILGHDSDDYMVITINNNEINVDYTVLMKNFDKSIEQYLVNIEIEKIE